MFAAQRSSASRLGAAHVGAEAAEPEEAGRRAGRARARRSARGRALADLQDVPIARSLILLLPARSTPRGAGSAPCRQARRAGRSPCCRSSRRWRRAARSAPRSTSPRRSPRAATGRWWRAQGGRLEAELAAAGGELVRMPVGCEEPGRDGDERAAGSPQLIRREHVDLVHARSRAPAWSALARLPARRRAVRDHLSRHLWRARTR